MTVQLTKVRAITILKLHNCIFFVQTAFAQQFPISFAVWQWFLSLSWDVTENYTAILYRVEQGAHQETMFSLQGMSLQCFWLKQQTTVTNKVIPYTLQIILAAGVVTTITRLGPILLHNLWEVMTSSAEVECKAFRIDTKYQCALQIAMML